MKEQKLVGNIGYWNDARGFGFVRRVVADTMENYFIHASKIMYGTPQLGVEVRFRAVEQPKGMVAIDCEIGETAVKIVEGGAR